MVDTANSGDGAGSDRMADAKATPGSARGRAARAFFDSLVSLLLAVLLFRTFAMEGYMIPTGSMAPCLLGHHKRIVCPSCRYPFAVGISESDSGPRIGRWIAAPGTDSEARDARGGSGSTSSNSGRLPAVGRSLAVCPNCLLPWIDTSGVPPNCGDQLLVHKNAYEFRSPRRWEIAVFRNPNDPRQAYVKRIVGLPRESLEIKGGDVYINGQIQRKDLATQRRMRIAVYDSDYRPLDDRHWRPRWRPEPARSAWKTVDNGFRFEASEQHSASENVDWAWLAYHHWIRSGGLHRTTVTLSRQAAEVTLPAQPHCPVEWDADTRQLSCTGALAGVWRDRLMSVNPDPETRRFIRELYEQSHDSPITDGYGYNTTRGGTPPAVVRDLMLSGEVRFYGGRGQFAVQMTDGHTTVDFVIDTTARRMTLSAHGSEPVRTQPIPDDYGDRPLLVEMSLIDRQALVAVDGRPAFNPWPLASSPAGTTPPRFSVGLGARGLSVEVQALKLYRDIYYTRGKAENGASRPFRLSDGEYFMLGDNSPVSSDSRNWPSGAVPDHLLLGKPLVLHLPSRPGRIKIGSQVRYIRIPDVSRIRYIR